MKDLKTKSMFSVGFWSVFLAVGMLMSALPGTASADITGTLTPDSITETHDLDELKTYTLDYSIDITGGATGKADVLFLTDTTGSMYDYIDGIKIAFSGILTAIDASLPGLDINYAVSDYRNYLDGGNYTTYGVNLTQPFTANTGAVQTAINGYSAGGGDDGQENQLNAMINLANNWTSAGSGPLDFGGRSDAQKILIWAGDWTGHIAGDEPGSSGTPPAGYYPTLATAVSALQAQGILTFGLNTTVSGHGINKPYGGIYDQTALQQQEDVITAATGGTSFYSVGSGGSTIEDAIVSAITGGVETLTNITMSLQTDDGDFVVSPWSQTLIGSWTSGDSPVTGSFDFDATAPGFADAVADFDMVLLGNGAELDRTDVYLTTIELPIEVVIDIKPSSFPNSINPDSKGVIPVAILGTEDFDASTVEPTTVGFGPGDALPVHWALEDVDGDGDLDLILHFKTQDTGISEGDTKATINGWTIDGIPISGTDSVRTVPPKGKKK